MTVLTPPGFPTRKALSISDLGMSTPSFSVNIFRAVSIQELVDAVLPPMSNLGFTPLIRMFLLQFSCCT
jgi:hypothetical protein